jgi:CHASE3 domain sensor protein
MKDKTTQRVYVLFLVICAVIVFAAAAAFRNIQQAAVTADWVNHTHATIYAVDRVTSSLIAGDGAARTHVWTGEARELSEARGEFSEMSDHLESLSALTREDAALTAQVTELGRLAEEHAAAALALAAGREGKDRAGLETLLQTDPGLETLREVKRHAARIRAGQFELLDARDRAAYRQAQTTRWVVGTCVVLNVLLLGAVAWLVRSDIATRRKLAETLQSANEVLEAKVQERTRDLAASNARLTTENHERKWAAQSLEHQLRYNQIIVNAASDLVLVTTKTLTITRINPAVSLRSGVAEEAILGKSVAELLPNADGISPALRSGREMHNQPAQLRTASGALLPATFTLLPIRDNDKVVGGVIMIRLMA